MSLKWKMETENVVYIHNVVLFRYFKKDIMNFSGKWIELQDIILSEVTQTQKDMCGKYSVISVY